MLIVWKETQKNQKKCLKLYIYKAKNHNLWELTCEYRPWKPTVQNSVRIADPENCLIGFLKNSETVMILRMKKLRKKNQSSETCPKNWNRRFSQKVRTAQQQLLRHCDVAKNRPKVW